MSKVKKRIHIIDSIGFCDSHLDAEEVHRLIKEQIKCNTAKLHKVIIVTSGRIELQHKQSIEQILKWLNYDPRERGRAPGLSFIFLYTKMDGKSKGQRATALAMLSDRLRVNTDQWATVDNAGQRMFGDSALAVGFNPKASVAEIKEDYDKLMSNMFDTATPPIEVEPRLCSIM